jgi:hypothetical protein
MVYRVPAVFDSIVNAQTQPILDTEWVEMWSDLWPSMFLKKVDNGSACLS